MRPRRTGPIATASCCRPATARCCSIPALSHRLSGTWTLDEMRISGSSAPRRRAIPSTATRRHRDDDRPARPGHRQRRRHGARRASCSMRASATARRPQDLCDRRRRLPDGRHQPRSDLAGRAPEAGEARSYCGTTTASRSTGRPACRPRRPAARFEASGWRRVTRRRPRSGVDPQRRWPRRRPPTSPC
jgi:hypothetical protein